MEPQTMEHTSTKKNVYNMERYEQIKEEIFKYRCERYRTIHKEDLNIKVSKGTFTLYFDLKKFLPIKFNNVCNSREAELYSM